MKHQAPSSTGSLRAVFGAWLLVSALVAGQSFADPEICGCEKRGKYTWTEHLQLFNDMIHYKQQAQDAYAKALAASREARVDWESLEGVFDGVSAMKDGMEEISAGGRDLQSQFAGYRSRENKPAVRQLLPRLEEFFKEVKDRKAQWTEMNVGAFVDNQGAEVRKEEKHYKEFFEWRTRFDGWYDKADKQYYTAISLPCLKREFESIKPLRDELSLEKDAIEKGRGDAMNLRQSAVKARGAVDASFKDCDAWRAGIARTFDCPPDAGEAEIIAAIKPWLNEHFRVTFRNTRDVIEALDLEEGSDLVEPESPFVPNGPKFLYWKERSKDGEFKEWGSPISRNLDLEAVWTYEIRVSGIEDPLAFPVERWDDVLPSSVALGSARLKDCAARLKASAGPGKVFIGWASAADPDSQITERSGNIRNGTTLQPIWAKAVYLITYVVPGGTPPPVDKWEYNAEGPFPVPPPLPELKGGFTASHWSLEPDGPIWTGGVAITNNITVHCVRVADYNVRYHDEDGTSLDERGAKKGKPYVNPPVHDIARAKPVKPGNSIFAKGRVFTDWRLIDGERFDGGVLAEDIDVYARYRDETPEEVVRRILKPLEDKVSLLTAAVADVALLALLIILAATRARSPRKPMKQEESASEGEGESAPAPAEDGDAQGGEDAAK